MVPTATDLPMERWPEWLLVDQQYVLLREVMDTARESGTDHLSVLFPLLYSIEESTNTLRDLVRRDLLRDAYVIARVVYETAVNACFIAAGGPDVAARAQRHARQKTLRDLERTIEFAGQRRLEVRWSGAHLAYADPVNQAVLQEFTTKSGHELTSWTPENVKERLDIIYQRFGNDATLGLTFALLLYRHASEIVHGTLYGSLFTWGMFDPNGFPKSGDDMQRFRIGQCHLILMLIGVTLGSLLRITAGELGLIHVADSARDILKSFYLSSRLRRAQEEPPAAGDAP
jgi:Family of unknown function (DUF5677)